MQILLIAGQIQNSVGKATVGFPLTNFKSAQTVPTAASWAMCDNVFFLRGQISWDTLAKSKTDSHKNAWSSSEKVAVKPKSSLRIKSAIQHSFSQIPPNSKKPTVQTWTSTGVMANRNPAHVFTHRACLIRQQISSQNLKTQKSSHA